MDLLAEIDRRARWRSVIYLLTILLYASLSCQDRSGKESLFPGRLFAKTDVEAPFVEDKSPAAVFVSRMMGSFRRSTFALLATLARYSAISSTAPGDCGRERDCWREKR